MKLKALILMSLLSTSAFAFELLRIKIALKYNANVNRIPNNWKIVGGIWPLTAQFVLCLKMVAMNCQ